MSILDRIRRIAKASVNDALDKAEVPEKVLKQKVRELEEAIRGAKQALANYAVSFRKMEKDSEQLKRIAAEWYEKAQAAMKLNDEGMARKALEEKLKAEERAQALVTPILQSRSTYEAMKNGLVTLQDQLQAASLRLSELQSRKQAAAAQKVFGDSFSKANETSAGGGDFARMEDEVLAAESEVEVEKELRGEAGRLEAELSRDIRQSKVDAELAALKKSV